MSRQVLKIVGTVLTSPDLESALNLESCYVIYLMSYNRHDLGNRGQSDLEMRPKLRISL
jgi:hypothetical protein